MSKPAPAFSLAFFFGFTLALVLALSSLNSKAMGLAWFLLVVAGGWVAMTRRHRLAPSVAVPWAMLWLMVATLSLCLKAVGVFYWSDPWDERHGELRLFFGALAVYALLRFKPLDRSTLILLAHSLTLSSAAGLVWVLIFGRWDVASHPIPWAGAMAMGSSLLLALSLKSDFSLGQRRTWLAGGLLALMAVMASQSRGAFGIVFWWFAVGLHHAWHIWASKHSAPNPTSSKTRRLAWVAAALIGFLALSQTPVLERPAQSLQDAVNEIRVSSQSTTQGANSSVGARLYMWQNSLTAIEASPWVGHGREGRIALLREWADAAQSDVVKQLGHVHNEYLHQMVDHGLWGLSSQLVVLAGLLFICWQLFQRRCTVAAFSLAGIVFVHMTVCMSNVNFAHNYYTASFSLFVSLSLWLSLLEPTEIEC
jgi:O-antigen ligase